MAPDEGDVEQDVRRRRLLLDYVSAIGRLGSSRLKTASSTCREIRGAIVTTAVTVAEEPAPNCDESVPLEASNRLLLAGGRPGVDDWVMRQWERASFQVNTRPIKVERDIRRDDLLAPSHERPIVLAALCLLCGLLLSVLYVYFPLLLITFAGFDLGGWLMGSVAVGAVASAVVLYRWERRDERDFLSEL